MIETIKQHKITIEPYYMREKIITGLEELIRREEEKLFRVISPSGFSEDNLRIQKAMNIMFKINQYREKLIAKLKSN